MDSVAGDGEQMTQSKQKIVLQTVVTHGGEIYPWLAKNLLLLPCTFLLENATIFHNAVGCKPMEGSGGLCFFPSSATTSFVLSHLYLPSKH